MDMERNGTGFLPTRIIPTLVTDQFLLKVVYIFRKTVTIHIPSWMVCYYVAEDTRSIEHPYSRLFSVPVEARRTMTAGASSLLMTVEYIITRKKKRIGREILSFGRDYFDPSDENNKFTVPINP